MIANIQAQLLEIQKEILGGNLLGVLTRFADLILVSLVAVMVGLMIVPLPTFLLDIFLTINITVAVTILMVSIYISSPTQIASYPTLLLITTLYRLSLDISATRLILLKADAGEVIRAFGMFVVSGNFVVGAVIFLIITLVQFIVITKGAERVAEVSARFTLDAMPGKQMSIDADLRAGIIDFQQARHRREGLARESQFYGAMDGAMKFVKGDAIAGIVITLINIVGGLIIGVAMNGHVGDGSGADLFHPDHRQRPGLADSRAADFDLGRHGGDARRVRKQGLQPGQGRSRADSRAAQSDRGGFRLADDHGDHSGPAEDSVLHSGGTHGFAGLRIVPG